MFKLCRNIRRQCLMDLISRIPKVELHLHIEGTFEPELMLKIAKRNNIQLPYKSVADVKKAYEFTSLQSFLDIYYQSAQVLLTEEDFHDLTYAYFQKVATQNVRHVEMIFDPQTHTSRNVAYETVVNGIWSGMQAGLKDFSITSKLMLGVLRDLTEEDAFVLWQQALPHIDKLAAISLNSAEQGNPPSKFAKIYQAARDKGLLAVAHAGEEGPSEYIWQALNLLKVNRIDHGVRCTEDEELVTYLKQQQIPLTMCPLSNTKLCVYKDMSEHPIAELLRKGLCVTVNSDDPSFFGGYIEENYRAIQATFDFSDKEICQLAENAIQASFLNQTEKQTLMDELNNIQQEVCHD